jgi:DnaJ-class molecular chaperone
MPLIIEARDPADLPPLPLQAAYRALAKQHHPDAGGDQEQFLRVQAAWDGYQKERVR